MEKGDKSLQDPPPQYEPAGYGYNQQGTGYGFDQPAMGYNQPARPAENYGYDQPAPGYPQQPVTQQQTTVVMNPSSPTVVVQHPAERPPDYLWLSCLVYWCCCWLIGCVAFGFSMASSSAADEGRMEEARGHGKAALWTSVVGIFIGIPILILLILYWSGTIWSDEGKDDYYTRHNYYG